MQGHGEHPEKGGPQTVRDGHQLRRNDLQGLQQPVITVYLNVEIRDNVVKRDLALSKVVVLVRNPAESIGKVKGKVLLLGI